MSEANPDKLKTSPTMPDPGVEIPDSIIDIEPGISTEDIATISQYLSDISPLLTEGDIRTVLRKRDIAPATPLNQLSQRDIDLAEAEAYYKLCDQPVGGQTVKDVDGSWSHTEGGWGVSKANIDMWYKKYVTLRELWGEQVISRSRIRIINL
ncbi:MAG: hypothetical protein K2M69_01745 [Muribaculaceae bacterium]|nr:hypothetical protein [Muribaculaceae bacterium]